MSRFAVITAIYDNYDALHPIVEQEGGEVDWVCVTDRPREGNGWRVVVEPRPMQHPNVAAKRPKMLPWEYTDAPASVWVDASFQAKSAQLAKDMLDVLKTAPIAQFRHPWRDCIYEEAEASRSLEKYAGHPIAEQLDRYRQWGHPAHWGLWATGFIAREHAMRVCRFGEAWLRTCQEWSFQDQLSEAVYLRHMELPIATLPGDHMNNPWVAWQGSSRH